MIIKTGITLIYHLIEALIIWAYCIKVFGRSPRGNELTTFIISSFVLYFISLAGSPAVNIIAYTLMLLVCINYLYSLKWYTSVFISALLTALMALSELCILSIATKYMGDMHYIEHRHWLTIILGLSTKLLYFMITSVLAKTTLIDSSKSIKLSFVDIIPIFSVIMIITLSIIGLDSSIPKAYNILVSFCELILLIINLLVYWLWIYIQDQNSKYTSLQLQLQKEQDIIELQTLYDKNDMEQKILIHDIKNHLNSIYDLNSRGESDKISQYIEKIALPRFKSSAILCDNNMLNLVLSRYVSICDEAHISFSADIRSNTLTFLTYEDTTSLFCNLLNNSVEAARDREKGFIELSIRNMDESPMCVISLSNTCTDNPFDSRGSLVSMKKNPGHHGIGLKSVNKIVSKYNGEMNMRYEDESLTFFTVILLKKPAGHEERVQ